MKNHTADAPTLVIDCVDETAMQDLGVRLLPQVVKGSLVTLSGELGAGKSVLARALIHAAGYKGRVKSPTYTLIESYLIDKPCSEIGTIAHLDLYRLADPEELHYIGFDDVLLEHNLVLIEWPEKAASRLPAPAMHIVIKYLDEGGRRVLINSQSKIV